MLLLFVFGATAHVCSEMGKPSCLAMGQRCSPFRAANFRRIDSRRNAVVALQDGGGGNGGDGGATVAQVLSVPWCGQGGMLPLQRFSYRKSPRQWNKEAVIETLYVDQDIIVLNKPSGIMCVPGPKRHERSAVTWAYRTYGRTQNNNNLSENDDMDRMVVHRLDMATSGLVVLARTDEALRTLHDAFAGRRKEQEMKMSMPPSTPPGVKKTYQALVCGHVASPEGEIDLPLCRDWRRPPFMRVYCHEDNDDDEEEYGPKEKGEFPWHDHDTRKSNEGFWRMMSKAPKASLTEYRVLSWEYLDKEHRQLPVTRLELTPRTGRTHQLRVHCAALGHPIVGDSIYGRDGDGSPHGGLSQWRDDDTTLLQGKIATFWNNANLCLHACQLALFHPTSRAPLLFESEAPF